MAHWLNIDDPTLKLTFHVSGCTHVEKRDQSKYKPTAPSIDELHRDGGWVSYPSRDAAKADAERVWNRWRAAGRKLETAEGIGTCPRCIG